MKNLLYLFFILPCFVWAQSNCSGGYTEHILNGNKIRATYFARGNKFYADEGGGFLVPFPSTKRLSTVFASSPWIGGFDDTGILKSSMETYPNSSQVDFGVGPLTDIGTSYPDSVCKNFDRAWSVYGDDIRRHIMDFQTDFVLDDTIASIFGWPARGNKYFNAYNGFSLPDNFVTGLASFRDFNGNGMYDPDLGDYPVVCTTCTTDIIPDQILWMVFNDLAFSDSLKKRPLRMEIQLTAYAFNCQDRVWLNNTVFNTYKIISKAVTSVDSVFFGMWTDYDLGCPGDDVCGSDSLRNTEYVYNRDAVDGDSGNDCSSGADTYAEMVAPIQSMTYLSHPMHSFIVANNNVSEPMERYNLLNGIWQDGTLMRAAGDGYDEDDSARPTKFFYHGDPRDSSSWAEINEAEDLFAVRTVSSVFLGRVEPGQINEVHMAYMYHHDPNEDHLGQFTSMNRNIDSLRSFLFTSGLPCAQYPVCNGEECVWPGDFNHNGRVDHEDYLPWGVMNNNNGLKRADGLVNWQGHSSDNWSETYDGDNYKHGDGNGDGIIDPHDIDINTLNNLSTNITYVPESNYPVGNDLILTSFQTMYHDTIRMFRIKTGRKIENLLGISFEIEFDTAAFEYGKFATIWSYTEDKINYQAVGEPNSFFPFAFVDSNHVGMTLDSNAFLLVGIPYSFRLRPGKVAPDSMVVRLRNLKGIDPDGNDLHFGSNQLVFYRNGFVSTNTPNFIPTTIYPNPTDGLLYVQSEKESAITIFDLQGKQVKYIAAGQLREQIDISNLPPGLYIFKVLATGETLKLVVQ